MLLKLLEEFCALPMTITEALIGEHRTPKEDEGEQVHHSDSGGYYSDRSENTSNNITSDGLRQTTLDEFSD